MEADGSDAIPAWPGSTPIGYIRGTASNDNAERHMPFAFDMPVIAAFVYFSPQTLGHLSDGLPRKSERPPCAASWQVHLKFALLYSGVSSRSRCFLGKPA